MFGITFYFIVSIFLKLRHRYRHNIASIHFCVQDTNSCGVPPFQFFFVLFSFQYSTFLAMQTNENDLRYTQQTSYNLYIYRNRYWNRCICNWRAYLRKSCCQSLFVFVSAQIIQAAWIRLWQFLIVFFLRVLYV